MKHIQKQPTPQFFINDTAGLTDWARYNSTKKRRLKGYILAKEQFELCCYCEKSVTASSSHVEHIEPKSNDVLRLTFDYNNLLVSCEGNHFNEIGDNSKNTCGHKKDNDFDEVKFLNPITVIDISDYFVFDSDTGLIGASDKDTKKATYTLGILNLNGKNDKLAEARKNAKEAFIRNFPQLPLEDKKQKLREFLDNDGQEFITFFRYVFKNLV